MTLLARPTHLENVGGEVRRALPPPGATISKSRRGGTRPPELVGVTNAF
jgi:hypothetical protein